MDYTVPEGNIYGIRNGFPGFYDHLSKPVTLTAATVDGEGGAASWVGGRSEKWQGRGGKGMGRASTATSASL